MKPPGVQMFEDEVHRILTESGCKILKTPDKGPKSFDFGFVFEGRRIALEAKRGATTATFSGILGYQAIQAEKAGYEELWLVTYRRPPNGFASVSNGKLKILTSWISLHAFAERLNVIDESKEDGESLQIPIESLVKNQLPEAVFANLSFDDLQDLLKLGDRHEHAIAVMSDIKSFTDIVLNSEGRALNEMVEKYYSMARALARKHNGTFDKTVGDAVLAIFGYPESESYRRASVDALKFGMELIFQGRSMLEDFFSRSTVIIETGTRVALASGDIWPVNVGVDAMQLSFIGRPINLAARLQHYSELDGLIICQNTWNWIESEDGDLVKRLDPADLDFKPDQLSGIRTGIHTKKIAAKAVSNWCLTNDLL